MVLAHFGRGPLSGLFWNFTENRGPQGIYRYGKKKKDLYNLQWEETIS